MQSGMTFKEILSHMAKYSFYHQKRCANVMDGKNLPEHVWGPCGQISVGYKHPLPLHYDWTIQTWQGHILNITVFEVNVPFVNHHCNSSFLLLTETTEGRHVVKQMAKLCGQSHNKIFYSAKNALKVVVEATDVKPHTVHLVHFQYEAVSHKALSSVKLTEQKYMSRRKLNATSQLLHFISHTEGYVHFYRAVIFLRFVVSVRSDCNVKIYDGPSSKSPPLKANLDKQGHLQYTSTLYFIAVYFTNIHKSSNTLPRCIYLSFIRENITIRRINISRDVPYTLHFNFNPNGVNIYHKFLFLVPQKMYVNIQLKPFKYAASTEDECSLNGIIFYALQANLSYGPFCGELGMNILMERGLTFGSHTVFILIYSFAESVYRQTSFGINVKGEFCAGFLNPCNYFKQVSSDMIRKERIFWPWFLGMNTSNKQFDGLKEYYNCRSKSFRGRIPKTVPRTVGINVDNTKADTCYHIQYFSTTLQGKECLFEYSGENAMNVTVSTYFNHYQAERCHNCSGMVLRTYPLLYKPASCQREWYVTEGRKKYHEVSTTNNQVLHIGSASHFLFWSAPVKNVNRTIIGEFHVMAHSQGNCSVIDLGNLPKLSMSLLHFMDKTVPVLTNNCSVTSFNIKRNGYFSMYNLLPWLHITFNIKFENPTLCNDNNHSLVLFLVPHQDYARSMTRARSVVWAVHEGYIKWSIRSSKEMYTISIIILQVQNKELTTLFQGYKHEILFREIECTDQLRVHIKKYNHHTSSTGSPTTPLKHCVNSACYHMYKTSHNTWTSWTSAADVCKKHKQQLLTVNSNFESDRLNDISQEYKLLDSPVLFLNLRRDSKVCILVTCIIKVM